MSDDLYDVVIIGGGPAGLAAAQYASRANLNTLVLDKSRTSGALALAHKIENYPGVEAIEGAKLLDRFRQQADNFGAEYKEAQVFGANLEADEKQVITLEGTYKTKTVIIATGSMGRKAAIEGEEEFLGRGVSYCAVCDAAFFKDRTVCVIGTSEEAAKEAGYLSKFASLVYLICPKKELKISPDHPTLSIDNVKVLTSHTVKAVKGTEAVESISMKDPDGNDATLELSGVFMYLQGSRPIVDFLGDALKTGENGCLITDEHLETSIKGVYAAGDVRCTEVRQVVAASSDGAVAALSAEKHIFNRTKTRSDWAKG